jgi:glycosyltransferase involved in cell wall biosynthesis
MSAARPLVSVIVPAYQAEAYLDAALISARDQNYDQLEVIVIDDGSTDRTAEIAAAHGVRVLSQPNGGPAAARNAGVAVARGEFVTILDADDIWPRDRLSQQVEYMREHPEVGIVFGLTEMFLTPNQERPAHRPVFDEGERVPGHPSTMLVRRDIFELIGGFDESLRLSEDVDWLARAVDAGVRTGRLERTLLYYRIHDQNTTRDVDGIHTTMLRALRASVERKRGDAQWPAS